MDLAWLAWWSWKELSLGCFFPFSPDGLERKSRHDIWASNELCSFCRLCCWGPGSCRIIHIRVFQSLCQSSTWWGLCLAYCERTGLVPWPWGDTDLWLYGLCQTVLFVSLGVQPVFVRSDVYWPSWMVLKGLCLVLDDHVKSLLRMGGLLWWVCHIAGVML